MNFSEGKQYLILLTCLHIQTHWQLYTHIPFCMLCDIKSSLSYGNPVNWCLPNGPIINSSACKLYVVAFFTESNIKGIVFVFFLWVVSSHETKHKSLDLAILVSSDSCLFVHSSKNHPPKVHFEYVNVCLLSFLHSSVSPLCTASLTFHFLITCVVQFGFFLHICAHQYLNIFSVLIWFPH